MARTATNYNLTTKTARARLAARPKGYYTQIAPCICLGYYRDRHTWERRERIAGRYAYRTLGTADDISPADGREVLNFEQAMRAATGANAAAPVGRLTVQGALDVYLTALASRSKYADDDRGRVEKHVPPALLSCRLDRLTKTPLKRSCSVVSPCNPLSVWSVGPQVAFGTDAGNPSPEITCAEAMEAPNNRAGTAAVESSNSLTRSFLFIISS